jgi:hypothetical protein
MTMKMVHFFYRWQVGNRKSFKAPAKEKLALEAPLNFLKRPGVHNALEVLLFAGEVLHP